MRIRRIRTTWYTKSKYAVQNKWNNSHNYHDEIKLYQGIIKGNTDWHSTLKERTPKNNPLDFARVQLTNAQCHNVSWYSESLTIQFKHTLKPSRTEWTSVSCLVLTILCYLSIHRNKLSVPFIATNTLSMFTGIIPIQSIQISEWFGCGNQVDSCILVQMRSKSFIGNINILLLYAVTFDVCLKYLNIVLNIRAPHPSS